MMNAQTLKMVNSHTRAGAHGAEIECPECNCQVIVFHFSWSALVCVGCGAEVEKTNWIQVKRGNK